MHPLEKHYHKMLAEYFNKMDYFNESLQQQQLRLKRLPPIARLINIRKVIELPWQLIRSQQWDKLEHIFTELSFLEAKTEAGLVFELVNDFIEALTVLPSNNRFYRILSLLSEALRRDIHFINHHPTTLFQCMWNSCWWYDCAESVKHYDLSAQDKLLEGQMLNQSKFRLYSLMESWLSFKQATVPGFCWIRSLLPPQVRIGSGQIALFRGHEGRVTSVVFSPDGHYVASGSDDGTVRVWDQILGNMVSCLYGHHGEISTLAFSPDGRNIVSYDGDKMMRIWDVHSGRKLADLSGRIPYLSASAVSPDGLISAFRSIDGKIQINNTTELINPDVNETLFGTGFAFTRDGKYIVSAPWRSPFDYGFNPLGSPSIELWESKTGYKRASVRMGEEYVTNYSISFCPNDYRFLIVGWGNSHHDYDIRVWTVTIDRLLHEKDGRWETNTKAFKKKLSHLKESEKPGISVDFQDTWLGGGLTFHGHKSIIRSATVSPDGKYIASGSVDKTIRLWDSVKGFELNCFYGHEKQINSVSFSSDGKKIVSGSDDYTVRIWKVSGSRQLLYYSQYYKHNWIAWSHDNRYIVAFAHEDYDGESGLIMGIVLNITTGTIKQLEVFDTRGIVNLDIKQVRFSSDSQCIMAYIIMGAGFMIYGPGVHITAIWDRESGKLLKQDYHDGQDEQFPAHKDETFASWHVQGLTNETCVMLPNSNEQIAWFPIALKELSIRDRLFASGSTGNLYVLSLEGDFS